MPSCRNSCRRTSPPTCTPRGNGRFISGPMADLTLGIDFGTSCTSAGILVGDRVELVQDGGDVVIPSLVYVPERGPLEVGRRAQPRLMSDPANVIRSVKRLLGLAPGSPEVRAFAASAPYRIETAGDHLTFKLRSARYAP